MMDTVIVALIAGVLGPGILVLLQSYTKRSEKQQEYDRLDQVAVAQSKAADDANVAATRAQEAADRMAITTQQSTEAILKAQAAASEIGKQTLHLGEVIHTLVNNDLSEALKGELEALEVLTNTSPNLSTKYEMRMEYLRETLANRAVQNTIASRQIAVEEQRKENEHV